MLEKYTKRQVSVALLVLFILSIIIILNDIVMKFRYPSQLSIFNIGIVNWVAGGILFSVLLGVVLKSKSLREKRIIATFFFVFLLIILLRVFSMSMLISSSILIVLLFEYMMYEVAIYYRTEKSVSSSQQDDVKNIIIFILAILIGIGIDYFIRIYLYK